ncbi:hypothetical protein FQN57_003189 [Myotisia sp. PD_48]|nr:hypothetical protein FQN57_003189 [Myotisia sp. PD_48]
MPSGYGTAPRSPAAAPCPPGALWHLWAIRFGQEILHPSEKGAGVVSQWAYPSSIIGGRINFIPKNDKWTRGLSRLGAKNALLVPRELTLATEIAYEIFEQKVAKMPKQMPSRSSQKPEPYPTSRSSRRRQSVSSSSSHSMYAPSHQPTMAGFMPVNTHHHIMTSAAGTMAPPSQHDWYRTANPSNPMLPPISPYAQQHMPRERAPPLRSPASPTPASHYSSSSASPWVAQDDEILLAARAQSQGWSQIQREHFPNKSSNACRKRYERLVAKQRSTDWNDERVDRVASQYMQMRERTWRPLADAVGEDWRDVEKLCLERGARTILPTVGHYDDIRRGASEQPSRRGSHESYDDERLSIHNLIHE